MTLPTRPLGRNGPEITLVGFGSWAAGGAGYAFGWGAQDDDASVAAMRHAVERGVNWIDTAAVYGLGHSEELVGRLLRELPANDRPLVFTKCGLVWDPAIPTGEIKRDLRPDAIRQGCEDSLRRLGVEVIDLFQFHWPDETGTPIEDSWSTMLRLVEEGKVRYPAVSNFNADLLERCEALGHVQALQPPFSLLRRGYAERELPWCAEHGTGVIVYSPMQSGILTERFSAERVRELPDDDWRKRTPEFQSPQAEKNVALRDALRPIAERHGETVSAVAVAWTTHWPGVTAAIVGARSAEQVDGWIGAASLQLTADDLEELAAAVERTGAGKGPVRPAVAVES